MKKINLLLPILSCSCVLPTLTICSCGEVKSQADKIAEAIINPSELTQTVKITSLRDSLKQLSSDELKAELLYDIFGLYDIKGNYKLNSEDSFATLYKNNKVGLKTNITKCGLDFDENNKITCWFLGYVSFVFLEDYSDTYKKNDYVMLTYDIQGQEVNLDEDNCSLIYKINNPVFEPACIGFAKIRYEGGKEVMQYIESIDTNNYSVKNSHNWVK